MGQMGLLKKQVNWKNPSGSFQALLLVNSEFLAPDSTSLSSFQWFVFSSVLLQGSLNYPFWVYQTMQRISL